MKEKIFIIGGSGFIGKHLMNFLSKDYDITIFDKFIDKSYFENFPTVKTIQINLVENSISDNFETPDFIINLASIVTAERNMELFDELIASNLKILLNIFERFKNDKRLKLFIQFGSSEEYGNAPSPYIETMREQPNSPYGLVKQLTTNTALMLNSNYGFPTCVVRPGNLYGEGQNPNKFIPYVVSHLKNNLPLDVTPCEQKRDFIHISRFCEIICELLKRYNHCIGEIINISSGKSITLKEIIEEYKQRFNSTSIVNYGALSYRASEMMDLRCDISKLNSILINE